MQANWTWAIVLTAAGTLACSGADPVDVAATVEAMGMPGPHAVGYGTFDISYTTPVTGETRDLTGLIWYPAEEHPDGDTPLYLVRAGELAKTDAPPKALGPRPVLVFSHGHQGYAASASFLMEHLASHGWVVVATSHKGNTVTDGDNRETDIYYLRAFDISATLDALQALPSSDPRAALISDQFAILGHSFGGYTAFMLGGAKHPVDRLATECADGTRAGTSFCSTFDDDDKAVFASDLSDDRFIAAVSLDSGDFDLFGREGLSQVDIPVLHMVAENSGFAPNAPEADDFWQGLNGPQDVRILLLGGAHNDFIDTCGSGVDLRCSMLPHRPVWRMVRVYTQAFLQKMLLGDDSMDPILDGTAEVSSLAEVTTRR